MFASSGCGGSEFLSDGFHGAKNAIDPAIDLEDEFFSLPASIAESEIEKKLPAYKNKTWTYNTPGFGDVALTVDSKRVGSYEYFPATFHTKLRIAYFGRRENLCSVDDIAKFCKDEPIHLFGLFGPHIDVRLDINPLAENTIPKEILNSGDFSFLGTAFGVVRIDFEFIAEEHEFWSTSSRKESFGAKISAWSGGIPLKKTIAMFFNPTYKPEHNLTPLVCDLALGRGQLVITLEDPAKRSLKVIVDGIEMEKDGE
jgi:hypothetical protein